MQKISATEAKQSFGNLMDTVQRQPVMVTRQGRPLAVVLSAQVYGHLCAMYKDWEALQKAKPNDPIPA